MMPRPAATGGLLPVRAQTAAVDGAHSAASPAAGDRDIPFYMEVFFAKQSKKKHKTWEDGILVFHSGSTELRREDGTCVTKSNKSCAQVKLPEEGSFLFMGSFELEVVKCITEEEYIQKGMDQLSSRGWDTSAATTQKPFQPISGNAPSAFKKKPLWQKKKEAKLLIETLTEMPQSVFREMPFLGACALKAKARAAHSKRSIAQEHTRTRRRYVGSVGPSAFPWGRALADPNSSLSVQSPGWGPSQAPLISLDSQKLIDRT